MSDSDEQAATAATRTKRVYRQGKRARSARATRDKVLKAAIACFGEDHYDRVTLKHVAEVAGVGLQTVIRSIGSKEQLFAAAAQQLLEDATSRFEDLPKDARSAVNLLAELYEEWGDRSARIMAQEDRVPAVRDFLQRGRVIQSAWFDTHFDDALTGLTPSDRKRRIAALLAVCGGRTWHVLRNLHGQSKAEAVETIVEMIDALLCYRRPT